MKLIKLSKDVYEHLYTSWRRFYILTIILDFFILASIVILVEVVSSIVETLIQSVGRSVDLTARNTEIVMCVFALIYKRNEKRDTLLEKRERALKIIIHIYLYIYLPFNKLFFFSKHHSCY